MPTTAPPGAAPPVVKLTAQGSPRAWFEEVEAFLLHLRDAGPLRDWNQAAFLFRSVQHDKVVGLIQHLEAKGIPVYAPRSNQFFDREEVQLAFGALIFLFPNFQGAAKRLYKGKDDPSVWAWTEACVKRFAALAKLPEHADLLLWARNKALLHHKLVAKAPHNLSSLFYDLLQFPALARFLGGDHLGNLHDSRPARNLARVSQLLARFESLHDLQQLQGPDEELDKTLARFCNQYLRFLYDGGIEEFEDPSEYAPSGCLSFMTVHQAKGLEFPLALVGSLDASPRREGSSLDTLLQAQVYPKKPFEPPDRIKSFDFWRLYYTAFSRPQELLVLTAHHDPDIKRRSPSAPFQALWDRTPSWRDHADALRSLSLPPVKPVDLKRRYAFTSHVTLYENCPRQYKFFRALQFATQRTNSLILGTLIHETIEDIHHAALRGEPQLIKKKQIGLWLYQNYRRLTAKENCHLPLHLLLSAHEQVMRYVEHVQSKHRSWAHIQEVEVALSLVRGHYILQGAIDLVQGEDLGVEVVDFKSERKPDLETEKTRIAKYKRQLEVYAYLLQTRFQKKVTRLHVHYTAEPSGIPTISFPASQESIDKTLAAFDQVVDKIEAKDFTLSKRPLPLCQRCDMKPYCDRLEKGATP